MKRLCTSVLVITSSIVFATQEKKRLEIRFPEVKTTRAESGATQVTMEGLLNTMEGGLPSVPVRTLKLAIPEGHEFQSARWTPTHSTREQLPSPILAAGSQIPISWLGAHSKRLPAETAPRMRGKQYPSAPFDYSLNKLHGVDILLLNLYPIQVDKSLKAITHVDGGTLEITFSKAQPLSFRPFDHQLAEVSLFVDNPEILSTYAQNGTRKRPTYDYLIISTQNLMSYTGPHNLAIFQESLRIRGLESKIVDLATLQRTDPGADLIEQIRAYVKQEYTQNGIRYLLLAGEGRESQANAIPVRKLWSKINAYFGGMTGWVPVEVDIPADSYYGSLDGEFNSNHNGHWGEPEDGTGGTDVDFLAELTVGRAVLRDTTDLQNFVRKTTTAASQGLAKNVLFLGEMLFEEKDLYGDEYMDQLIGSIDEHGYQTTGYGSDWNQTKFYDRPGEWTGSAAQAQINQAGFGIVNHLGHSNNSMNMRLSSSKIPSFKNVAPYFYYTQGCYAAGFNTGSFVDRLVSAANAAVAAVGNTSYGLAPEDPQPTLTKTPGASQMLHRMFTHQLMNTPQISLGKAHVASKEFFIGLKSSQEIRWVNWTANFFGDPSLMTSH